MNHNFLISVLDTDSLTISKSNGGKFSEEEIDKLTSEINSISDELVRWEFEFYIPKIIVIKAKNYILYDGKKIKTKGSSIRDQKKEPALKEMVDKFIECMLQDNFTQDDLINIYHNYIKEALTVKDISRWAKKINISEKVLACQGYEELTPEKLKQKGIRANETSIWDAVKNEEGVQQGDKYYVYPAILESRLEIKEFKNGRRDEKQILTTGLKMTKYWTGDHNPDQLVKRVYDTVSIFETILDMEQFVDYTLKKNKILLEGLK